MCTLYNYSTHQLTRGENHVDTKEISFLSKLTNRRSKSFVLINKTISNTISDRGIF